MIRDFLYEDYRLLVCGFAIAAILGLRLFSSARQFLAAAGLDVIFFFLGTFFGGGVSGAETLFRASGEPDRAHALAPGQAVLLGVLMLSAMIASAIVGEVAAILFVGGAMLHIAERYQAQADSVSDHAGVRDEHRLGGERVRAGGVTIALKANLTVLDFFRWATPIAVLCWDGYFLSAAGGLRGTGWDWVWRGRASCAISRSSVPDPGRRESAPAWILIGVDDSAVYLSRSDRTGAGAWRQYGASGGGAGSRGDGAGRCRARAPRIDPAARVDWATLASFSRCLSSSAHSQATGRHGRDAQHLHAGTGGRPAALVLAVGWSTGFLSAFWPTCLPSRRLFPIVADLKAHGAVCPTAIYWLMLFGASFMGNMTSIGSTCNIIACGMADKRGHGTIYFRSWLKIGLIISLSSMALATLAAGADGLAAAIGEGS